jgi:hypothetical protein
MTPLNRVIIGRHDRAAFSGFAENDRAKLVRLLDDNAGRICVQNRCRSAAPVRPLLAGCEYQPHVFDTTLSFIPMEPNQLGAVGTLGALYSQSPYS